MNNIKERIESIIKVVKQENKKNKIEKIQLSALSVSVDNEISDCFNVMLFIREEDDFASIEVNGIEDLFQPKTVRELNQVIIGLKNGIEKTGIKFEFEITSDFS